MKNKELICHMNYNLRTIQELEGSDLHYKVEDFIDAVENLIGLIKTYMYFKERDEALSELGKKVIGQSPNGKARGCYPYVDVGSSPTYPAILKGIYVFCNT